jgi:hypothetical protein
MKRRILSGVVLALLLGAGCARVDLRAAGLYAAEPWVDVGRFTQVGGEQAWIFAPALGWKKDRLPVWVTPETDVFLDGAPVGLGDINPGQTVRLMYELRRDGTGVAERIDVMGPPVKGAPREVDF